MNAKIYTFLRKHKLCKARRDLGVQAANPDGYTFINLHAMYRAGGQPEGKDPVMWAGRAGQLLRALLAFKADGKPLPRGYLGLQYVKDGSDVPVTQDDRVGDFTTMLDEIALLYAHYLDGGLPEDIWSFVVHRYGHNL